MESADQIIVVIGTILLALVTLLFMGVILTASIIEAYHKQKLKDEKRIFIPDRKQSRFRTNSRKYSGR